ncbi:MAG: mechanosensitive ion channel [Spirulina sp. SIO3F2]|nr:mechanosensitive ion channel [Spirulina sp. SIO3F2]
MLSKFRSSLRRAIAIFCLMGFIIIGIGLQPSWAQTDQAPTSKEAVVVDGRVLFRLGSIDNFTAERRVKSVNKNLQKVIQNTSLDKPIQVIIVQRNGLTTIHVNEKHLLTVTEGDFRRGVTPKEQAQEWASILQNSLLRSQQERHPEHGQKILLQLLLTLILTVVFTIIIRLGRRRIQRHQIKRVSVSSSYQLLTPGLLLLEVGVWLLWLTYSSELFPQARTARYQFFQFLKNTFTSSLLTAGEQSYSLMDISNLILISLILLIMVRGLTATVKSRILNITIADRGMQDAIATLIQFLLTGLGLFILLQAWGIDLSSLAILVSVLGVGLGFGLQHLANNFVSGWILLIERPMQVGDLINLGDVIGTVERIGWRSTKIQTLDRISIIVPNSDFVQSKVINWSHGHAVSRLHLSVGVAYGSCIDTVHNAVIEAVQIHPEVLQYPQPQLRFLGFGDSSLDFDILVWIHDPRLQFDIKSDLYYLLEANLRRYNIDIPFPQRDLNLRTSEIQAILNNSTNNNDNNISSDSHCSSVFEASSPPKTELEVLAKVSKYSVVLQSSKKITTEEITELVTQMCDAEGLAIQDRRYNLTLYPKCFVGSEAVTWIAQTQKATREAAVKLGQILVNEGIIHHVTDEHSFKDEYLFYRFYEDENQNT